MRPIIGVRLSRIIKLDAAQESEFWATLSQANDLGNESACWLWPAVCDEQGYGKFAGYRASRVAYYLWHNEQPAKGLVCHTCDTPACCNPHHLYLGTHKTNAEDRKRIEREPCKPRLTRDQVKVIRESKDPIYKLARDIGASWSQVYNVKSGNSYKHIG